MPVRIQNNVTGAQYEVESEDAFNKAYGEDSGFSVVKAPDLSFLNPPVDEPVAEEGDVPDTESPLVAKLVAAKPEPAAAPSPAAETNVDLPKE